MNDQFGRECWSWLRWSRLRWRLVDALERSAHHVADDSMATCARQVCCAGLADLAPVFGYKIEASEHGSSYLWFDGRFDELINDDERAIAWDGMGVLRATYGMRDLAQREPFAGFMEVPRAVGEIIISEHFRGLEERNNLLATEETFDVNREFIYALTMLAFPDTYLDARHDVGKRSHHDVSDISGNDRRHQATELFGQSAYDDLSSRLQAAGYISPVLSPSIIEELRLDLNTMLVGTPHFAFLTAVGPYGLPRWHSLAAYDLEFGAEDASLRSYWEDVPTLPSAFSYCERGNEAGTGMCFITRSRGVFVSQQLWHSTQHSDNNRWNRCTEAYNTYVAPILQTADSDGAAMVVFSDFRHQAYIVSNDFNSWDEYAPMSKVLAPLPDGWGIVGVWLGHDPDRYTPPSIDSVIQFDYSRQINACANYLKACLSALP